MRDVKPDDFKTGAVKYTDPSFVKILTTLKDMWDRGHFDPGGFSNGIEETQALFVQQKLAQFFIVPENFVKFLQDNKPSEVELGAFALPAMNGIEPNRGVGGAANILAVSATTKIKKL